MGLQTSIMYGFVMLFIMLGGYAYSEHIQKVSCQDKARLAHAIMENDLIKHKKEIESYEYAIKEIADYYNETVAEIDNFTKDEHETECQAANRLLNSFKY